MNDTATWSVGPSSVGNRTVSTPSTTKVADVFRMCLFDGVSNLDAIILKTSDSVTFLTFLSILIFGFLLSWNFCIMILSCADSMASILGWCPEYLFIKNFLAAWISSSEASLLTPILLYGSFVFILGKKAASQWENWRRLKEYTMLNGSNNGLWKKIDQFKLSAQGSH